MENWSFFIAELIGCQSIIKFLRIILTSTWTPKCSALSKCFSSFDGLDYAEELVRRNLPTDKSLNGYDLTTRNIADKIAKKLVERALEKDRRRLVRKIQRRSQPGDLDDEGHVIANNYVDVAVNRVLDDLVSILIILPTVPKKLDCFISANIIFHI